MPLVEIFEGFTIPGTVNLMYVQRRMPFGQDFICLLVHALQQRIYQGSHGSLLATQRVVINRQKSAVPPTPNVASGTFTMLSATPTQTSRSKGCGTPCVPAILPTEKTSSLTNRPWNVIHHSTIIPLLNSASSDFFKNHHQQHETWPLTILDPSLESHAKCL